MTLALLRHTENMLGNWLEDVGRLDWCSSELTMGWPTVAVQV